MGLKLKNKRTGVVHITREEYWPVLAKNCWGPVTQEAINARPVSPHSRGVVCGAGFFKIPAEAEYTEGTVSCQRCLRAKSD